MARVDPRVDRVHEQIVEVIAGSGLRYMEKEDFVVVLPQPFEGGNQSTEVLVRPEMIEDEEVDEGVLIRLGAAIVKGLPGNDEEILVKASLICNTLNQEQTFGRWVYYPDRGMLLLTHELLGEDLDLSELLNALVTVAKCADRWDDEVRDKLGIGRLTSGGESDVVE